MVHEQTQPPCSSRDGGGGGSGGGGGGMESGVPPPPSSKLSPPSNNRVPFKDLFRFADGCDKLLVVLACLAAIINGALVPVFSIIFGDLVNSLGPDTADLVKEVNEAVLYLLYLALAALIAGYVEVALFSLTGYRQTKLIRQSYLSAVLRQEIGWYDRNGGVGILVQGLNEESDAFQNAISERLGNFTRNLTTCIAGLIVAFWKGWDMAFVIVATMPFLVFVGMTISTMSGRLQAMVSAANDNINTIAQEALSNIRTLTAYGMQESTMDKFDSSLEVPRKAGIKQGLLSGLTIGATSGVFSCSYALAIWYGSRQVADGDYTGGQVINILFAGVMAGFSLGQAVPNIQFIDSGRAACKSLLAIIDRKPEIDTRKSGKTLQNLNGDIELEEVHFAYPTRPDHFVFNGFNMTIPAGKSIALVGESGSGKSSVIQLLQRYYDPSNGKIMVDGHDIRTLQLEWWRSQVSLVSQEPTLFYDSVYANIAMSKPDATSSEVIRAATLANAHTFITKLPEGYNTSVGEQGTQLSGGQRQRIAIARAILRNPKILLLDEATSALDTQSEKVVQESLDSIMAGRTTVIIAHRLSTVVNADIIAVIRSGQVIDQGSHAELVKKGGFYATLVARQTFDTGNDGMDDAGEVPQGKKPLKQMRNSVLSRASVRLSVIPKDIMNKLKEKPNEPEEINAVSFKRLALINKPEWKHGAVGVFASALLGLQMPGFALALAGIIGVFYEPTADAIRSGGLKWAGIYVAIGIGCWLAGTIQGWSFGFMGQYLASRVKSMLLRASMRQEIGWHDKPENSTGKIMGRISSDTMALRGAVGDRVGVLVQNASTVIAAYVIAFVSSWRLTLVVTALLPLMSAAQVVQTMMLTGQHKKGGDRILQANQVALEGVRNIKVVSAYGLQGSISERYAKEMVRIANAKALHFAGVAYGASQFTLYCVIAVAFWYGAKGVDDGSLGVDDLMKAFCALFFASFSLAQANVQFPDMAKAKNAGARVFSVIDRTPEIDIASQAGAKFPTLDGDVELSNVTFAYPSRPGRLIFKHFNIAIPAGTSCALVGESGHGKSTIVGLLQRFYDPTDGKVMVDGIDIRSLDLNWLRSNIGLVVQEPVMFNGTITENIKFGNPNATVSQIVDAARAANAIGFIDGLPDQFETYCTNIAHTPCLQLGQGGVQLSGGQKQRIAIARAILRNPKILILDEATSALDADSEAVVQEALDSFMVGRTTIIIAHRLATVCKANKIAAVYRGRVLEQGTHDELMQLDRYYAYLIRASQC